MGIVTLGANSIRGTKPGVLMNSSSRYTAPTNDVNDRYTGKCFRGDCSTELKFTSGALRSTTLFWGLISRKLLSFKVTALKLKPRKLLLKKTALRISELMASP